MRCATAFASAAVLLAGVPARAQGSWAPVSSTAAPSARYLHVAVWTGREMIVWGGEDWFGERPSGGGIYDPATNRWRAISVTDAPGGGFCNAAVWTGTKMILSGNGNARYDPLNDEWSATSTLAGLGRCYHIAVWTGRYMIVWGGREGPDVSDPDLATGGMYDPMDDTWTPTSMIDAPAPRESHSAVWTGREMIIWGGKTTPLSGGRFDPKSNTWQPMSDVDAAWGTAEATAVWTGSEMIIWDGGAAGRYDPALDQWTTTSPAPGVVSYDGHSAVWTGREMLVWGDLAADLSSHPGWRYDPLADSWQELPLADAPEPTFWHTVVWTGREMIVWGGAVLRVVEGDGIITVAVDAGVRFDPEPRRNGEACTAGAACVSGFCVDGVCCNMACNLPCDVCNLAGSLGTCAPAFAGMEGVPACGAFVCDGTQGNCPLLCGTNTDCLSGHFCDTDTCVPRKPAGDECSASHECLAGFCEDGVCCNSACDGGCAVCDVPELEGSCVLLGAGHVGDTTCGPYLCDGAGVTCPTACANDAGCLTTHYCEQDTCLEKMRIGQSCVGEPECLSGFCEDSVCCNDTCDGGCEICNASNHGGTCTALSDGAMGDQTCGPYLCDGVAGTCPTVCANDEDCQASYVCEHGVCVEQPPIGEDRPSCACRHGKANPISLFALGLLFATRRLRHRTSG